MAADGTEAGLTAYLLSTYILTCTFKQVQLKHFLFGQQTPIIMIAPWSAMFKKDLISFSQPQAYYSE